MVAELTRQAARQSLHVDDLLPRELWAIATRLDDVLDLTNSAVLDALGLEPADLVREDHGLTREIGETAHERGVQGITSPSATGVDTVLAAFPDNFRSATLSAVLSEVWDTSSDLTG